MKATFNIPNTPTVKVNYEQKMFLGEPCVPYVTSTVIKNPRTADGIIMAMLAKKVGASDIKGVEGITPVVPVQTTVADYKSAQYMRAMERD